MIFYDDSLQTAPLVKKISETIIFGRAVSRGVAVGTAICLHGRRRQFYRIKLKANQVELETQRFRHAVRLSKKQLKKIGERESANGSRSKFDIFAAQLLILEDKTLLGKVENNIREQQVNAEWGVKTIFDRLVADYKSISDEHLRERYIDLEDIADRILNALGGSDNANIPLAKNSIIIAKDVKPSTLIELTDSHPRGIITERGGWTSHTFILAREMNLPAVTGVGDILRRIETGDEVIVDGFSGKIILSPSEEVSAAYKIAARKFQSNGDKNFAIAAGQLKTLDNREITIRANVDLLPGYAPAKRLGAQGIGLYRSEFLFNQFKGFPSEAEQVKAYRNIAALVGSDGVRIRTFDLSVEQLADEQSEREPNPALGLRGIRLGLAHTEQFRTQLRALLQASAENTIDIVLPLVSDVAEVILTKEILREEKDRLNKRKIKIGNPRLGAMIEVPSAVLTIDEIAGEVDFLSLGTNDLVQYLLAVDRDNQSVADWFRTLHPAVLRAIKTVLTAADNKDVPVVVCGEMAGSPFYAPILIGMGATVLSMNAGSIARVRKIIAGIAFEEARELCRELETCRTADETESLVKSFFTEKWTHLVSPDVFPPPKK